MKIATVIRRFIFASGFGLWYMVCPWFAQADVPGRFGSEYLLSGALPGDQVHPILVFGRSGGYLVWEDNAIDGLGQGVGAMRLDANGTPVPSTIVRVNQSLKGDQSAPQAVVLPNGGIAIVWESGDERDKDVYCRILAPDGLFIGSEFRVNEYVEGIQDTPSLAAFPDGRFVIVWSSFGQDGSLRGVYARIFDEKGLPISPEFQVNEFTPFNQRDPQVSVLKDGSFVVVWISENQSFPLSADVVARRFKQDGSPLTGEVRVNTGIDICANPAIAATPNGPFLIGWSSRNIYDTTNRWDVVVRAYGLDGTPLSEEPVVLNEFRRGDQYGVRLASAGGMVMAVWTSLGQDRSWEEIYGRFLSLDGRPLGPEMRINTTIISRQIHPDVCGIEEKGFLVVWSSFVGGNASFEILGQRFVFSEVLYKPDPPMAVPLDSRSLMVSWPALEGLGAVEYLLYIDGASEPIRTTNLYCKLENLVPATDHLIQLAYKLGDGRTSPISDAVHVRTWGWDNNYDGLPDDWQEKFWGTDRRYWPSPLADSDNDGASNLAEFLAGTSPVDPNDVLRLSWRSGPFGLVLEWNAVPGSVYRVEASTNMCDWIEVVGPRVAASSTMSVVVEGQSQLGYYRVIRVR